jgi:predicted NBD/HSP70 family sugar kinase
LPDNGQPDLDAVSAANRARILALAGELGTVSCPLLAERSGLSRQTVYLIAAELERAGVLVGDGVGHSSGGRRPQLLRYEPRAWGAIGVEMREREACAVLTDLDGTVVHRRAVPLYGTTPAQVADAVEAAAGRLLTAMPAGRVLGIGAALPGLIDVEHGLVRMSVLYGWSEVPFAALLRERTGLPAYVASRPAAAALGEARAGAGRGARGLVYLFAGPSLGIGLAFDGELYQGISSSAGEFGHITILPDGPPCACGNRGCLNALASGDALLARAKATIAAASDTGAGFLERCGPDLGNLRIDDLAAWRPAATRWPRRWSGTPVAPSASPPPA